MSNEFGGLLQHQRRRAERRGQIAGFSGHNHRRLPGKRQRPRIDFAVDRVDQHLPPFRRGTTQHHDGRIERIDEIRERDANPLCDGLDNLARKRITPGSSATPLKKMPVSGTPIDDNLSRASGINIDTADALDITNTRPVTVYYIGGEEGSYYYVPVTRRVSNQVKDNITAVVDELVKGPSYSSNLVTDFVSGVKLLEAPKVENEKVTLNFNESIYGSFKEKVVSQHLLDALVLSITEQQGIKEVVVEVKGKPELVKEDGKKLTAPVTRPEKVNTGSF